MGRKYIFDSNEGGRFMDIRVRNIPDIKGKRIKAIAKVRFGVCVPDYVKMLLNKAMSDLSPQELDNIMAHYEEMKDED